jgi:chromosomal replication initiation ATPase DnaA
MMLGGSLPEILKMRRRAAGAPREIMQALRAKQTRRAIDVAISNVFGIGPDRLWGGKRGVRDIAEARQVAMYLAHVCCGMSLTEVGAMFGRDRTTVSYACLKVECRRDDPKFDRTLDVLCWALPTLVLRGTGRGRPKQFEDLKEHEWL